MTFGLVVQLIGNTCEEGFETGEESFIITSSEFLDELSNIKSLVIVLHWSIKRYKKVHEPIADFIVWKI